MSKKNPPQYDKFSIYRLTFTNSLPDMTISFMLFFKREAEIEVTVGYTIVQIYYEKK